MSYHWHSDQGTTGAPIPGRRAPSSTPGGDYGAPPPIPPRPAGFGYQPLPAEDRASAAHLNHDRTHSSSNPTTGSQTPYSDYSSLNLQSPAFTEGTSSDHNDPQRPSGERKESAGETESSINSLDMINEMLNGMSVSAQSHDISASHESYTSTYEASTTAEELTYSSQPTASHYDNPQISRASTEIKSSTASMPQPTAADKPGPPSPPREKDANKVHNQPTKENTKSSPKLSFSDQEFISSSRPSPPALRLQPVTECIGVPVGFATTWYTHPVTPEYNICSYCYEENIRHTIFENAFKGSYLDDGKIKVCRFSRARMKDCLFKEALAKGSLAEVINFMSLRAKIPECAGISGVKGPNPSGHWFRVKNNQIPPMVVCKACYEDYILAQHFAVNFEPAPEQPPDNEWACDMALAFIHDEYKRCSVANDWSRFVSGANTRMGLPKCPGTKDIYPDGGGKQWFEPINGPRGFLVCSACYCDCVHYTSEQTKWRDAGSNIVATYGVSIKCCFGSFNMAMATNRTLRETLDYNLFWTAVNTLATEPQCKSEGTTNATWYTLKTDPDHYAICRACYVMIVETWGISDYFMPKPSIPKTAKLICCLNRGIPRFPFYVAKTLELMLTRDPAPLTSFAIEYGAIPLCKQDSDFKNGVWYGWPACTICPECHHFFIRGTALADSMPIQSQRLDSWRMCEMYSPRMRKMYLEACASDPPDPTDLLTFSLQRRNIYANTMPRVREMISAQKIKFLQQQNVSNQSLFYSSLGRTYANTVGYTHTYGQAGVGYGFRNEWELDGARLGQQAAAMGDELRNASWTLSAGELERRWRQVE